MELPARDNCFREPALVALMARNWPNTCMHARRRQSRLFVGKEGDPNEGVIVTLICVA